MDKEIRDRLRKRHKLALVRAKELRKIYPDPVQALVELFTGLSDDIKIWIETMEEPYG